MLGFLNTFVLIGLSAVIVPLLIHFLARQKRQRIVFSSLKFLKAIHTQHVRQFKFQQWLILILRMLAVCFIILAFARPTCRYVNQGSKGANVSIILLMDRSMSMARDEIKTKIKEKINLILEMCQPNDELALIWTDGATFPRNGFLNYSPIIQKQVDEKIFDYQLSPHHIPLNFVQDRIRQAKNPNQEIYLISDMQATAFDQITTLDSSFSDEGNWFVLPMSGPEDNIALIDGGIESRILQLKNPIKVFVEIAAFGQHGDGETLLRIFLNEKPLAQKTIHAQTGAKQKVSFNIYPETTGWFHGSVQIYDNIFPYDNSIYFVGYIPDSQHIILIGSEEDRQTIKMILNPENFSSDYFSFEEYSGISEINRLQKSDVVFFLGQPEMTGIESELLYQYVRDGGGLCVIPGQSGIDPFDRKFLNPYLQWSFTGMKESNRGYIDVGEVNWDHPVLEGIFNDSRKALVSSNVYQYLSIQGQYTSIISYQDGSPFILEKQIGKGHVVLFTSGLQEPWSDFRYTPFCAPFFNRIAAYLSLSARTLSPSVVVGESIELVLKESIQRKQITLEKPSGDLVLLLPETKANRPVVSIHQTDESGIYKLYEDNSLIQLFAVQSNSLESDFTPISEADLKQKLSELRIMVIGTDVDAEKIIYETRWGRELWLWCVLIALFFLISEMVVSRIAVWKNAR